ncbi:futalosine hydrolase [Niabella insulamsoli]|uniref:phosphorylase family protein n=1 Tax=Niabella insulamsoli TaxID=3144874 RepID=UPI0031FD858E
MRILVAAASEMEIAPSIKTLNNLGVNVAITGIGLASSVYALTKAVQKEQPDVIIQAGIAGAIDRETRLGGVLAVSKDCFGDVGVVEGEAWKSLFDLGLASPNQKPFEEGWLINPHKDLILKSGLSAVAATTVNEITTMSRRVNRLKSLGIKLESMEGAALHYVALMEEKPFLQVRAISNYIGERDKNNWQMKESIHLLNQSLLSIVDIFLKM